MRNQSLVYAVILLLVAACSSTRVAETKPEAAPSPQAPPPQAPSDRPSAAPAAVAPVQPVRPDHLDPSSMIARERSVYFEFDAAEVGREYAPLIERHGQYLRSNQTIKILIEGHADERGGSEYNLALGQRRAEAVRSALRLMGVRDAQLEAISFGEEKPAASGHDEAAWQKNRRADIAYPK